MLFDEVYIKPSARLRGGHLNGHSVDVPEKAAMTALTVMVQLIMRSGNFIISLIPVFSLTAEFLSDILERLATLVKESL